MSFDTLGCCRTSLDQFGSPRKPRWSQQGLEQSLEPTPSQLKKQINLLTAVNTIAASSTVSNSVIDLGKHWLENKLSVCALA